MEILYTFLIGPMSNLFGGVHEQSYVAHALAFALRIGRFKDEKGHEKSFTEKLFNIWPKIS